MRHHQLPAGTPVVSVIIPSYNEGDWTQKTAKSILDTTDYPAFEVIVVNDNSDDGSGDFAETEAFKNRPNFKSLTHKGEDNLGVSLARHRGAELATGDLFIFLDAHMLVDPDWIRLIVEAFQKNPDMGLAAPMVYDAKKLSQKGHVTSHVYTNCDITMWAPQWLKETTFTTPEAVPFVNAAGLCVPRHIYEEVGGFPDWIQGWGPEDRCLSLLAFRHGYNAYRLPHVSIGHDYKEGLAEKNPELLALRQKTLTLNCLRSCYLLYNEEDFELVKNRLRHQAETARFEPDEALQQRKAEIDAKSCRTYEDFTQTYHAYLPYRSAEFFRRGIELKGEKKYDDALECFEKAKKIEYSFGTTDRTHLKAVSNFEQANIHYTGKNHDEGIACALEIFKLPLPYYPLPVYTLLGKLFSAKKQWSLARFWLSVGEDSLKKEGLERVTEEYKSLIRWGAQALKAELYDWLSVALYGEGRLEDAKTYAEKACEHTQSEEEVARLKRNIVLYEGAGAKKG